MWKGKRVHIGAIESPFQRDEAHFLEATYFDELAENTKLRLPGQKAYYCRDGRISTKHNPELITPHPPRRVDQGKNDRTTKRIKEPVERATSQEKSVSSMGERPTFYDVFRGQILL